MLNKQTIKSFFSNFSTSLRVTVSFAPPGAAVTTNSIAGCALMLTDKIKLTSRINIFMKYLVRSL